MLISKIIPITLKTIYSTSQLAPCSCTPEGKGRIFPKERRPSVLLTQSRTHIGPECLDYLIISTSHITVKAAFGSRDKLCYHILCSTPSPTTPSTMPSSRSHPGCTAELVASPGDVPMKARPMRDDCNTDVANRKAESES